ncbi:MAG: hypothetical protein E6L08_04510 [Verrucomicrobia bacterium]|nr:MAG: hypothetical protein E6L08_04510 [Verrucomicrobiota bacterium]
MTVIGNLACFRQKQSSCSFEHERAERATRTVRSRISSDIWEQIKTVHASGIGTRDDIEGTRL